jgi:nucleotide-binding universal stress UspA family protein
MQESTAATCNISLTSSVAVHTDSAGTLIDMAEHGTSLLVKEGADFETCDIIALTTHGRSGLEHWALGSSAERVLGATKLPLLIVHPLSGSDGDD